MEVIWELRKIHTNMAYFNAEKSAMKELNWTQPTSPYLADFHLLQLLKHLLIDAFVQERLAHVADHIFDHRGIEVGLQV